MAEGAHRTTDAQDTLAGCTAPFAWTVAGPGSLALLAIFIAEDRTVAGIRVNGAFLLAFLLTQLTRVADIRRFRRRTKEAKPPNHVHLRRHAVALAAVSAALWATGRLVLAAGWLP